MKTNQKKWIIYFASGNFYSSGLSSVHHLLDRLKDNYNILFFNSLGLASVSKIKKSTIPTRVLSKLKSFAKYLKEVNGYTVFSPISIPLGITSLDKVNSLFVAIQIKFIFTLLKIKDPILIIANPKAATLLHLFQSSTIIYLYSDKYSAYREIANKDYIDSLDYQLQEKSNFIVSNLKRTYDELCETKHKSKSLYLPHSVDFHLFNDCVYTETAIPDDLKFLDKPIIGYYGTLTNSNDWDLIIYLAKKRPTYNFVFIGKPREDINQVVFTLPNVHFLGYKPYNTLPMYLKHFSVCLMFWKRTDWIYNSNPLKTKEFLAMGKPIVSVRIYELEKSFNELIYICDTKEQFLSSIDKALTENSNELTQSRIDAVKDDSWEKDVEVIRGLLELNNV